MFEKGRSGNPAGRPRGTRNKTTGLVEGLLQAEAQAITGKLIEMAKAGDASAMRLCMARLAPPTRGAPVPFELPPLDGPADAQAAMAAIAAGLAAGELSPAEAAELAKVVAAYVAALMAIDEEKRVERKAAQLADLRGREYAGHLRELALCKHVRSPGEPASRPVPSPPPTGDDGRPTTDCG